MPIPARIPAGPDQLGSVRSHGAEPRLELIPTLLWLKPTHRLGRRFLLIHRQGPRVSGHGPGREWDAGAGGPAGWRGAIVGSRGRGEPGSRPTEG